MARSKKKLVFVHRSQFPRFFYNVKKKFLHKCCYVLVESNSKLGPYFFFWKRYSIINKQMLNKRFGVYNGFKFQVMISDSRYKGYKLGEFSVTRRSVIHKGKQRQIKKRDKNKSKKKINKYTVILSKEQKKISNRQKERVKKRS